MSIDWAKAEEKPDKKQAVEGRFLLDLRAKVNDLEKQLTDTKNKLNKTQSNLKSTGVSLENTTNLHSLQSEMGHTGSR